MCKIAYSALVLSTLGLFAGCGGRADLAQATGVVTFKGEPVAEAKVMLHPLGGGARNSYGTTNEKGEFKLSTFGMNDGALVGRHAVTVSKTDTSALPQIDTSELATKGYTGASYEAMMGPGAAARNAKKIKHIIPEKYSAKETSGIEVDVVKGESNHFPLDISE
mgnify:FL=1